MSNKTFNFQTQLAIGNKGEALFKENYKNLNPQKSEILAFDFIINGAETVELKSDSRMKETQNFFMELYSDIERGSIGGIWRASQDRVKWFVYSSIEEDIWYWFDTQKLVNEIDKIIFEKKYKLRNIRNTNWTAQGYVIPKQDLLYLVERTDIFKEGVLINEK